MRASKMVTINQCGDVSVLNVAYGSCVAYVAIVSIERRSVAQHLFKMLDAHGKKKPRHALITPPQTMKSVRKGMKRLSKSPMRETCLKK